MGVDVCYEIHPGEDLHDGVTFMRSNRALPSTPALYEPSIVIVIQGRKSGLHAGNLIAKN